jgi:choline dehydrogenase-like flavoprotein
VDSLVKYMNTIYQGVRSNSSVLQGKPNITLMFRIQAKDLLIDGTSVTGIVVVNDNGKQFTVNSKKEVIVSCRVFETLKLLTISGIGAKGELLQQGIQCAIDPSHVVLWTTFS